MYKIIRLDVHADDRGELVAIENGRNIPFDIKRVFYIFNVGPDVMSRHPKNTRGYVSLSNMPPSLDNGRAEGSAGKTGQAVYIDSNIWIELSHFSKDCVLLVLSDVPQPSQIDYREFIAQNDTILNLPCEPAVPFDIEDAIRRV